MYLRISCRTPASSLVAESLRRHAIPPSAAQLEVTVSVLMDAPVLARAPFVLCKH
jgi:hypothetical protein